MKRKVFSKKLSLNKNTVANLNKDSMSELKGGKETGLSGITCLVCDTNISCYLNKCLICEFDTVR